MVAKWKEKENISLLADNNLGLGYNHIVMLFEMFLYMKARGIKPQKYVNLLSLRCVVCVHKKSMACTVFFSTFKI